MSFIYKKRSKLLQNLLRKNKHIHLLENCWINQGCCVFGYLFLCKGVSRCLSGHLRGRCFICSPILPQKIQLCNSKTLPKQCQFSANRINFVSKPYQFLLAENITKFALQKDSILHNFLYPIFPGGELFSFRFPQGGGKPKGVIVHFTLLISLNHRGS